VPGQGRRFRRPSDPRHHRDQPSGSSGPEPCVFFVCRQNRELYLNMKKKKKNCKKKKKKKRISNTYSGDVAASAAVEPGNVFLHQSNLIRKGDQKYNGSVSKAIRERKKKRRSRTVGLSQLGCEVREGTVFFFF
jgi:hypothetical protein